MLPMQHFLLGTNLGQWPPHESVLVNQFRLGFLQGDFLTAPPPPPWGFFTLSLGHLPIRFCFICPSFCFISPSNLLHFPNKLLHLPNNLLHFPNRLLHFPNEILTSPSRFCFTLPKTRTQFFDIFSLFSSLELNFKQFYFRELLINMPCHRLSKWYNPQALVLVQTS